MKNLKDKSAGKALAALLLILAPAFASNAASPEADSLWNAGVRAYEEGRWMDAVRNWEDLEASSYESVRLSCNLGDAYFKAGDYPRAILNYERALKLDPSDDDSRFNLEIARANVQDKIDVVPEFFLEAWGRKACYLLSSNTWAVLSVIFLAGALALLLVFLLSSSKGPRKAGFWGAIASGLLFLLCLEYARWQYADYRKADSAIVMTPVASVKSSPSSESAKDLFILHEGTKVKLLDEAGGWRNIELSDGRQGWMKSSDMEII